MWSPFSHSVQIAPTATAGPTVCLFQFHSQTSCLVFRCVCVLNDMGKVGRGLQDETERLVELAARILCSLRPSLIHKITLYPPGYRCNMVGHIEPSDWISHSVP